MEDLTKRQLEKLPILVVGESVKEACKNAQISRSTFYQWMQSPAFMEKYNAEREKLIASAFESLGRNLDKACKKLVELLDSKSETIQHRSAVSILEQYLAIREVDEILGKIEMLNMRLDEAGI